MKRLCLLDDELWFPDARDALEDPDGLVAVGGDLCTERLKLAYASGIFPWYSEGQPILWWSPNPRCVVFPERIHISRSLRKTLRQQRFRVTLDHAFPAVIHACAVSREETTGTWITGPMEAAYNELHRQGLAHSIECWRDDRLVGGLYGIAMGRCFFGESMFSYETDASKVAFVHLAGQLRQWNYDIIDCQVENPHLISLGAESISRERFLFILEQSKDAKPAPHGWHLDWNWND